MKKKTLLDSYALLSYLNQENGSDAVKTMLADAQKNRCNALMNEINIGETFYILFKKRGKKKAEYFLNTVLAGLPISIIHNSFDHIVEASRIKARFPISFSDCFAVATACNENALILTGNPEFKYVEHMVDVLWIGG